LCFQITQDFQGQELADKIYIYGIIASSIISFVIGFVLQDLFLCCAINFGGLALVLILCVPPWPFYSHGLEWLDAPAKRKRKRDNSFWARVLRWL
jgi:signal peptidase complex subunit 1